MKLVIQIPAFNEAETLPRTLAQLPRALPGLAKVEWLVIDDGSTDGTADVARAHGVDHVVRFRRNRGLARAFEAGVERALAEGADIVVNTDADDQYVAADIALLVAPILDGSADLVVGERPMKSFGPVKRLLQRLGTWVVRRISGADVQDAASGFRAMSRETARSMKVFNEFSYTVETLIQAGLAGWAVKSVPVRTNEVIRPSRLFRSTFGYVGRQTATILRILVTYRPFRFFAVPGVALFAAGFLIGARFLLHYLTDGGQGRIQSLILAALAMGLGAGLLLVGLVTDLVAVNRKLLQSVEAQLHARAAAERGGSVAEIEAARRVPRSRMEGSTGR